MDDPKSHRTAEIIDDEITLLIRQVRTCAHDPLHSPSLTAVSSIG